MEKDNKDNKDSKDRRRSTGPKAFHRRFVLLVLDVLGVLVVLFFPSPARALIDRKFTPIELVRQSDIIVQAAIRPTASADEWELAGAEAIKGKPSGPIRLKMAVQDAMHREDIRNLLAARRNPSALLFAAAQSGATKGFLLVEATWLTIESPQSGAWEIKGFAQQMSAVFAGGADMLAQMSRYILADPKPTVPVAVGTEWASWEGVAKLNGKITGMAVIEIAGDETPHLFVSSGNDRDKVFRPKKDADGMDDVTAALKLDTHSRRFVWMDVNRDGLADLVSWDGSAIAVVFAGKDGAFATASERTRIFQKDCLDLAPAGTSPDGAARVLVSAATLPFLLQWTEARGWTRSDLPSSKTTEAAAATSSSCIVADLDNDGFVDVLQPRETDGLLWRGASQGFAPPVRSPVAAGKGPARHALGDFNGDGCLDVFLGGSEQNSLWENDGKGSFRDVIGGAGSLNYKSAPGASDCAAADLNHDGRTDLALCFSDGEFIYHFNRGFRCFGEEGDLQLGGVANPPPAAGTGVESCGIADFNGDGSEDLAVAFSDGSLCCFYNEAADVSGFRVRLEKGAVGPVTVSAWQGEKFPGCIGTYAVAGHSPGGFFALRFPGDCQLRWSESGKPSQTLKASASGTVKIVVLKNP